MDASRVAVGNEMVANSGGSKEWHIGRVSREKAVDLFFSDIAMF